jgi:hypothetical protein
VQEGLSGPLKSFRAKLDAMFRSKPISADLIWCDRRSFSTRPSRRVPTSIEHPARLVGNRVFIPSPARLMMGVQGFCRSPTVSYPLGRDSACFPTFRRYPWSGRRVRWTRRSIHLFEAAPGRSRGQ